MSSRLGFLGRDDRFRRLLTAVLATSDYEVVVFRDAARLAASVAASPDDLAALIVDTTAMDLIPAEILSVVAAVPTIMISPGAAEEDLEEEEERRGATAGSVARPITLGRPLSIPRLLAALQDIGRGGPTASPSPASARREVIVVDDDESFRIYVEEILRSRGYTVHTAGDGVEALQVLDAHPSVTTFVVDLEMPRMDGPTLIGKLRERVGTPSVLIMTGTQDIELRRWGTTNGYAFALVEKPFTSRTFLRYFGGEPRRA